MKPAYLVVSFLTILCLGCSDAKKLQRILGRHPEWRDTVIVHDTVEAIVESIYADSVVRYVPGDTFVLTKDRVTVKTVYRTDTMWQEVVVKGDTVFVPIEKVVQTIGPTQTVTKEVIPWWVPVALLLTLGLALFTIIRKR